MNISKFLDELMSGAIAMAHYISDDVTSGNFFDLSSLVR